MASKKRTLTAAGVTRETLEDTPERALQFLFGVGTRPTVRALLAKKGYDKAEHKRGWQLLEAVAGRVIDERATDVEVSDAIAELDNWDEPGIKLIRAGLTKYREIRAQVLDGITPIAGPGAVLNVAKILERLDEVERDTEKWPDSRAAMARLAARGLDADERKRLAKLVAVAKTARDADPTEGDDEAYLQALLELREWFEEWSEIARLVVTRRDHLIRLGLAERRSSDDEAEDPSVNGGGPSTPTPMPEG